MSDSYSPLLMTVDEQGRTGADFEGHISAEGVDLLAATSSTDEADRQVRWLRESDGSLVARVKAYTGGASAVSELATERGAGSALSSLVARQGDLANRAKVNASLTAAGAEVYASASFGANSELRRIIDDAGSSDFVQGRAESLKEIRGIVNTAGPNGSIIEGAGFTLIRNGVGDVKVTFTEPFSGVPTVTGMHGAGSFVGIVQTGTGGVIAGSARLTLFDLTGASRDGIIHFRASGPVG